jgi:putative nucleotidyltransferase with HDIG domain
MKSVIRTNRGSDNLESKVFRKLAHNTDEFESYPQIHAARIATLAGAIAKAFNLGPKDLQSLRTAALLHDLGEVSMNRGYLKRAGSLTEQERLDLERHTIIGEQEAAKIGVDRAAQLIIRWHHEWWNGGGYPDALRREEIPLAARILRVADSYASITDARPFRPAKTKDKAREHMTQWASIEFDPRVVNTLLSLDPMAELESFALSQAEIDSRAGMPVERELNLFSSFGS